MALVARHYVVPCPGEPKADLALLKRIEAALAPFIGRANFGVEAMIFRNVSEIEGEGLDPEILSAGGDLVVPLIWVNVTFDPEWLAAETFGSVEREFNLRLVDEIG